MQERQTNIFDFEKYEVKHSSFKNSLLELNRIIDWSSFLPILMATRIMWIFLQSSLQHASICFDNFWLKA
ncbi:MAG: hypothetical protein ACK5X7_15250 [Pseudanabaena sp.]|jgi:hypothetical protein